MAKEEKCANSLSSPFTKENIQIAKVNHEKGACFVLLVIKERQIQITLTYQHTPTRLPKIKQNRKSHMLTGC